MSQLIEKEAQPPIRACWRLADHSQFIIIIIIITVVIIMCTLKSCFLQPSKVVILRTG